MQQKVDDLLQTSEQTFFPLTEDFAGILRSIDLTAAEWRLWSLISTKDFSGDRTISLDTETIMKECRISRSTLHTAIKTLQRHGLIGIQPARRYLTGVMPDFLLVTQKIR
jgi:hypothetical protein